ncbi:hypothetical protein DL769_006576 [Monosporascus sp. CRB-8-3]|nr:hypothetical protein DL769_006576 [Monosporascus sp. CRB-8-3]
MTSPDRTGITDAAAIAEHEFMQRAEHEGHEHEAALRRGITDEAAIAEYQFMHRAEQEEHEHEAAAKRGLPDEAAEWEYDLIHGAERQLNRPTSPGQKVKHALKKIVSSGKD